MKRVLRGLRLLFLLATLVASGLACRQETMPAGPPEMRLISHLPALTEICFALGLERQLVGVTDFCHYPPAAKQIPSIGGILNPDFEKVVTLRPTLILLQDTQKELIDRYTQMGLRTLVVREQGVADVWAAIRAIGQATGRTRQAEQTIARIQAGLSQVRDAAAGKRPVRALIVIGHDPGELREVFISAHGSFHDELLQMAGGVNCFADSAIPYTKVSIEEILHRSPDVVLVLKDKEQLAPAEIEAEKQLWSALGYLEAVKHGRIHVLSGDYLLLPGPRLTLIAEQFYQALHGKRLKD